MDRRTRASSERCTGIRAVTMCLLLVGRVTFVGSYDARPSLRGCYGNGSGWRIGGLHRETCDQRGSLTVNCIVLSRIGLSLM